MDKWISVDSKLPRSAVEVLAWDEEENVCQICEYDSRDDAWSTAEGLAPVVVKWWMPLPKPPVGGA